MSIRQRGDAAGAQQGSKSSNGPAETNTSNRPQLDDLDDKGDWLARRERLVRATLEDGDLEQLGRIATLPGGFGTEELRKEAWAALLRTRGYFPAEGSTSSAGSRRPNTETETENESLSTTGDKAAETVRRLSSQDQGEEPSDGREEEAEKPAGPTEFKPHPDEHQVLLDTKRSFVSYPKGLPTESKLAMQADLQALIVHVLRLHPTLSYFQGFHDIMSVLYLTFIPLPTVPARRSRSASIRSRDRSTSGRSTPFSGTMTPTMLEEQSPTEKKDGSEMIGGTAEDGYTGHSAARGVEEEQPTAEGGLNAALGSSEPAVDRNTPAWTALKQCAEVVSVCRVRDAMGRGMEPMMGLLKILQRLLHAADPELSRFSAAISPVPTLPFFALSWILCLFSHDIDTLEPVQRMFDFLLSRNPVSAIYLAVAITVAKKDQMFELARAMGSEAEDDPSLLHPLFSRLPPLVADTPASDAPTPSKEGADELGARYEDERNPYDPIPISRIFHIADDLLARYPWDGPVIRGREIMGPGSVVNTYVNEHLVPEGRWDLREAECMTDMEVILPGGTMPDQAEEEGPPRKRATRRTRPMRRRQQKQVALALGVVVVGVGIAVYGWRAGGSKAGWGGWWAAVVRSWMGRQNWERGQGVLGRMEDMLLRRARGILG